MMRMSTVFELAKMYLRAEINTWQNIQTVAEGWPNSPRARVNAESARRSASAFKALLDDLEEGNIIDDMEIIGGRHCGPAGKEARCDCILSGTAGAQQPDRRAGFAGNPATEGR